MGNTKGLQAFVAEHGKKGVMPGRRQLENAGRADLIVAIGKHGGFASVDKKLDLERPNANQPAGYWDDFTNVEKELRAYTSTHDSDGVMPTLRDLNSSGHSSLAYAINKHGGFGTVAKQLGLQLTDTDSRNR